MEESKSAGKSREYYVALTYRAGTSKSDMETVDDFLKPYMMSDFVSFDPCMQPVMPSELRNPEIKDALAQEVYIFNDPKAAEEVRKGLKKMKFVLEVIVGEPVWSAREH